MAKQVIYLGSIWKKEGRIYLDFGVGHNSCAGRTHTHVSIPHRFLITTIYMLPIMGIFQFGLAAFRKYQKSSIEIDMIEQV